MSKVLLMTKVKNDLKKHGDFEFKLSNININGAKRGCSGFVMNPQNGIVVYVNTEKSCYAPLNKKNLVRYAKNDHDYIGSINEWATDEELATKVVSMLNNKQRYEDMVDGYR